MKSYKPLFNAILFILLFSSCRPFSKESYLEKYGEFINEISNNSSHFSDKEWKSADEKFIKFNDKWYDHFKDELTWQEKLTTTKYNVQYSFYKTKTGAMDFFNSHLKGDYEKLKDRIKYYKENKMDGEIQNLLDKAKVMGDSSVTMIQGLIKDIEKETGK